MPFVRSGQKIPDFVLKDQHGVEFKLSELRGRKVLLSFHPLAFTKVCTRQMQSLEKSFAAFDRLNAVPVGISVDTVPSKHAWAREIGVKQLRMLSDFWPHGKLAQKLGIFRKEQGFSERANIIVDEFGKVAWVKVYPIKELPDIKEVLKVIA